MASIALSIVIPVSYANPNNTQDKESKKHTLGRVDDDGQPGAELECIFHPEYSPGVVLVSYPDGVM
jgi:hypothetical protein